MVIKFNTNIYDLDTRSAPDFMDQDNYIAWLTDKLMA